MTAANVQLTIPEPYTECQPEGAVGCECLRIVVAIVVAIVGAVLLGCLRIVVAVGVTADWLRQRHGLDEHSTADQRAANRIRIDSWIPFSETMHNVFSPTNTHSGSGVAVPRSQPPTRRLVSHPGFSAPVSTSIISV